MADLLFEGWIEKIGDRWYIRLNEPASKWLEKQAHYLFILLGMPIRPQFVAEGIAKVIGVVLGIKISLRAEAS